MSGSLLMPQSMLRSSFLSVPSRLTCTLLSSRKLGLSHLFFQVIVVVRDLPLERVLGNVEPLEEVGGAGAELVGGVHGVAGDVDHLVAVLHNVEVDLELAEQEVPVVSVDEELEVVGPGLESAEGIVVLDELVQLGGGVEGHLGVGLPHDGVGVGLVLPQGLVGPHGLAVLGSLDLDGSAQVQFNLKLVWRSPKGELVVLVVGLEVSLGNLAAHDGVLAPQSELGALHLNLALQLNNALRTLLDVDDNVGLIRSTFHTDLTVVLDSPDVSLDDDVHVLAGPVEGALDGGGCKSKDGEEVSEPHDGVSWEASTSQVSC